MSGYQDRATQRVFNQDPLTIAAGATAVVDVRGVGWIAAYFAGTCTITPCTRAGVAITGATAISLTTKVAQDVSANPANFYLVAPVTQPATVMWN